MVRWREHHENMFHKITIVPDFPTDPMIWRNWFAADLNTPGLWISSAQDLLDFIRHAIPPLTEAWRALSEKTKATPSPVHIHRVFLLLAAYAFENLLKAMIVALAGWRDEDIKGSIPKELKTHDLLFLADQARLKLSVDERELLERLSEFAYWRGRYPAPTNVETLKPKKLRSGIVTTAGTMRGSDIREIQQFANKLISNLDGIPGREHLRTFTTSGPEPYEEYAISPSVRAWP